MPPKKPGRKKKGTAPSANPPVARRVLRSSRKTPLPTVPEDPPAAPDLVFEDSTAPPPPAAETAVDSNDERVQSRFATAEDIFDFRSEDFDVGYDQIDPNKVVDFPANSRPPVTPQKKPRTLPAVHPSPLKPDPSSLLMTAHTIESIHPYVYRDLKDSTIVPLLHWVEVCLGRDFTTIHRWATIIKKQKWFHDTLIQKSMVDYCTTKEEIKRYTPFINIGNRILSLARGRIPGVAETNSYPIDDLCFGDSSAREVKTIPEHGKLGARRKPDIVMVRKDKAEGLKAKGGGVEWSDIFFWWEMKGHRRLTDLLDKERKQQGLSSVDDWREAEDVAEIKASAERMAHYTYNPDNNIAETMASPEHTPEGARTSNEDFAERKTGQAFPDGATENSSKAPYTTTPDLSSSEARAGVKRKLEDREPDDVLAGMGIPSSILARDSHGTAADLVRARQAALQCTGYALEHSGCTRGTRVFSHAAVIKEDRVFLWRYGPNGIMYTTTPLSLVTEFSLVAAIMVAIALLTPEQFGAVPTSVFSPPDPSYNSYPLPSLQGCTLRLRNPKKKKPVSMMLQKNVFTQYTLMGRRTFLYKAIADPPIQSAEKVIIKFSYQHATRVPEPELLLDAINAGVSQDHLPEIHLSEDLWTLPDVQREAYRLRQQNQSENSDAEAETLQEPQYEDRVLRAIVYTQYFPVKELFADHPELISVMVDQILDCLHELRVKARILHRDISINNIMWTIKDGKLLFKLIDFDNAARLPDETNGGTPYTPTARTRSGTLPFMAHELVMDAFRAMKMKTTVPMDHFVRHDFESLFFVSLWCAEVLYVDSMKAEEAQTLLERAKSLESGTLEAISNFKQSMCVEGLDRAMLGLRPSRIACLEEWFDAWSVIFIDAVHVRNKHLFDAKRAARYGNDPPALDLETLNGTLTYEILKAALSACIPPQAWTVEELTAAFMPRDEKAEAAEKPKSRAKRAKKQKQAVAAVSSMLSRLRPRKRPAGAPSC